MPNHAVSPHFVTGDSRNQNHSDDSVNNFGIASRALIIFLSLLILIVTAPFFMIIPLLIKLTGPGPVFYRGVRLGLNKRPYVMYKFRTLHPDAQQIIGASLVTERHKLVTPIGDFLRETRLDELPQLINVLKGDMNLVGPRPERPEIYEYICKSIPGYDKRFEVRPGVIGYAQLFTPHNSPKRLRSMIDRNYHTRKRTQTQELLLLTRAIWLLSRRGIILSWSIMTYIWKWIIGKAPLKERRQLRRTQLKNACAFIQPLGKGSDSGEIQCKIIDTNRESILIRSKHPIPSFNLYLRLENYLLPERGITPKRKIVYCEGEMSIQRPTTNKKCIEYVIDIDPITPLNEFKYDKYFRLSAIS
jgi:lipopolysaccharide/colanic/teichoic acid biosynthesis glycosyltransferase